MAVSVYATAKASSDRTVSLYIDETATTAAAANYSVASSVTIPAGAMMGSFDVTINNSPALGFGGKTIVVGMTVMKQFVVGLVVLLLMQLAIGTAADSTAVNVEAQSITIALSQEPPNLNSLRATDLLSFFVLGHVNEGLVRYGRRGRLVPCLLYTSPSPRDRG